MATAAKGKAYPTTEEIIAMLKKTSLPTVICEGSDDLIIYRRLEDRLVNLGVSVLPVGGRLKVLEIFQRRSEIPSSVQLAFVADQDTWVNTGVPPVYSAPELLFTDGYSIENDVFCDGNLLGLLVGQEATKFYSELDTFLEWYALALARHLADQSHPIALHPEHVLDPTRRAALLSRLPGEAYPTNMKGSLLANYQRLLRGKSLLALLVRNTNTRTGQPRHSEQALLESVAARPGPLLERTVGTIQKLFSHRRKTLLQNLP